eukprot:358651-Chlamydomonas_euryale.AAC.2
MQRPHFCSCAQRLPWAINCPNSNPGASGSDRSSRTSHCRTCPPDHSWCLSTRLWRSWRCGMSLRLATGVGLATGLRLTTGVGLVGLATGVRLAAGVGVDKTLHRGQSKPGLMSRNETRRGWPDWCRWGAVVSAVSLLTRH